MTGGVQIKRVSDIAWVIVVNVAAEIRKKWDTEGYFQSSDDNSLGKRGRVLTKFLWPKWNRGMVFGTGWGIIADCSRKKESDKEN